MAGYLPLYISASLVAIKELITLITNLLQARLKGSLEKAVN